MRDLYKIMSGIIYLRLKKADIFVSRPSIKDMYQAEIFADDMYDEAFREGCYTQEEMVDLLLEKEWWSDRDEQWLELLPKNIEQMKLDYYLGFNSEDTRKTVKSHMDKADSRIQELTLKKHLYYEHTCEGIRSAALRDFLVRRTTFFNSGEPFDFITASPRVVALRTNEETLGAKEIRQVSKTDAWRSVWSASQSPFEIFGSVSDMTPMQNTLIMWSRVYDNIYESTEPPDKEVIEDDIALDGWFIYQRRKREEEMKKSRGDKVAEKLKDAGEILVPINSESEFNRVQNMNTREAKMKSQSRFSELEERGSLSEQNFRTVRKELAMEANRQAASALKGRR